MTHSEKLQLLERRYSSAINVTRQMIELVKQMNSLPDDKKEEFNFDYKIQELIERRGLVLGQADKILSEIDFGLNNQNSRSLLDVIEEKAQESFELGIHLKKVISSMMNNIKPKLNAAKNGQKLLNGYKGFEGKKAYYLARQA